MADQNLKIISVSGASGSGKSTLTKHLNKAIDGSLLLSIDRYYLSKNQQISKSGYFNFDDPASIDVDLLIKHLEVLKTSGTAIVPIYDFTVSERSGEEKVTAQSTIIIDGLFAAALVGQLSDLDIYVDVDLENALKRRLKRDIAERGRTRESVIEQFENQVRPSFYKFIEPLKESADLIIENNSTIENLLNTAQRKIALID